MWFSARPQPAPRDLQEKFCKKIWDKFKNFLLWDSHSFVVKCEDLQNVHIVASSWRFMSVLCTIMHVLGFVSFRSERHLLCRIPRKVFAKNPGQDKKFCWDTLTRLWANVKNAQKYTYYGLIFDNLRQFLSFIVKYRKNTNWFNHIPIFTFLLRYQSNQERFRMCGFWVRPQPAPEKFLQKIWDKWKTFLLRDTLEFVVTCRNHQMYHLYANFKRLCKDLRRIKHILRFVIFVSDHHLLCRISRKSFAKNLRRDKKFCSDTLTHLWYNVKIVQNAYYVPILDRFVAFLTDL